MIIPHASVESERSELKVSGWRTELKLDCLGVSVNTVTDIDFSFCLFFFLSF